MLGNKDAAANIAVRNLETASKFYGSTLGLKQVILLHRQRMNATDCRSRVH